MGMLFERALMQDAMHPYLDVLCNLEAVVESSSSLNTHFPRLFSCQPILPGAQFIHLLQIRIEGVPTAVFQYGRDRICHFISNSY